MSPDISHTDLLAGRYELGVELGRGGMGVVHRAWDRHLNRFVAVKILRNLAVSPVGRARFRDEGQTLARLSHPGLITLFDAETENDEPYLVMELVEGDPLNELCAGHGLPIAEVARIGAALAEALEHVHRQRVIHRDIKPSNVLISRDGRVKLADFGVAQLLDDLTRYTATGMTMGTVGYLSPEQVRGEPLTPVSDIYSLGLVLIEALSGVPAFAGSRDVVALLRLTASPRIDESLPAPLRELLAEMTARDPSQRPSAAEVAIELPAVSGGSVRNGAALPAGRRSRHALAAADSADVPTASSSVPTQPSSPVSTPRDGSAGRSGRLGRAVLVALALAPVLLLASAVLFAPQLDWPGGSGSGARLPAATGSATPSERAADPTGAARTGPTGAAGPASAGPVAGVTSTAGAATTGPATTAGPPGSATGTPSPTATELDKAAARESAKAARESAKAARESARASEKAKDKGDG